MLKHRSLANWEAKLKKIFDRIDDHLEDLYGKQYSLHPNRARRGLTGNKEQDGLFNVGASYSLGIGSEHGSGYIVEVRLATLAHIEPVVRTRIGDEVAEFLTRELPISFPGRKLDVARDGNVYKIFGDLSLGKI